MMKGINSTWTILTAAALLWALSGTICAQIGFYPGDMVDPLTGQKAKPLRVIQPAPTTRAETASRLEEMVRIGQLSEDKADADWASLQEAVASFDYAGHNWVLSYDVSHEDGLRISNAFYNGRYFIHEAYVPWLGVECTMCEVLDKLELTSGSLLYGPMVVELPTSVCIVAEYNVGGCFLTEELFFYDDGYFIPSIRYWDPGGQPLCCVPIYVRYAIGGAGWNFAQYWWNAWHIDHYEFALSDTTRADPSGYNILLQDIWTNSKVYCKPFARDDPVQFVERLGMDPEQHPVRGIIYPQSTYSEDNCHVYMIRDFASGTEHHPQYLCVP